jgi:ABC-type phosphate/phosphonate transport system substrate-binding protein
MIAALPMYDHPAVRADWDALWAAIRGRLRAAGIDAPDALDRSYDLFAQWRSPDLLLGQTCGLPFRAEFHRTTTLLGAMDFGLDGSPPGYYHSLFVARADDPRSRLPEFADAVLTFNEAASHSGWGTAVASGIPFRIGAASGSHRASARRVAAGLADIAAIDAISWRLIQAHMPVAARLKVVGCSRSTPGQALITAFPQHAQAIGTAIVEGIDTLPARHRQALGLHGFVALPIGDWLAVPNPPVPEAFGRRIA